MYLVATVTLNAFSFLNPLRAMGKPVDGSNQLMQPLPQVVTYCHQGQRHALAVSAQSLGFALQLQPLRE